jgi:DNA-binding IclR family transcriptional regulator
MNGTSYFIDWHGGSAMAKPEVGEPVLDRAFCLLGSFDADHRVQTLAGLSRRTGTPRSTTLRLARKLTELGALERDEQGRYAIGVRLLEIASLAPRGHGLRQVAMPVMEDLFQVTRQHVLLTVRDEDQALLVERLSAHDAGAVRFRVGERMPLTSTGGGLVLLAFAPVDLQEQVLASYRAERTPDQLHTDLRRALAEIRRGGYATASQDKPWPRSVAAAPLRDGTEVVAALSVVTPSADFDPMYHVAAVRAAAQAVSRQLNCLC